MLTAQRIVENIRIRTEGSHEPILVFWCQILSDRDEMRRRINSLKGELDLVPIPIRSVGFDNPNAVLTDLNNLIREHKHEFERGPKPTYEESKPIVVLLLSHTDFTLPQIASLITLPDWFPRVGGQNVFLMIEDLTAIAHGPMNAPEAHVPDLAEKLFNLEVALVSRMSSVAMTHRHSGQELFQLINHGENEKYREFLELATKYHGEVQNPRGFRPTVRESRCLHGRLIDMMRTATPDQISNRAKALSVALGIPEDIGPPADSLTSVLLRPTNKESAAIHVARNLVITIYASAQFITAAAHADDYGPYPILLLRSMSFDLRNVLDSLAQMIERLPPPAASHPAGIAKVNLDGS